MENDILKRLNEHITNKRKSDINKVVTDFTHSSSFILNIVQIYGRNKRFSYRLIAFQDMCFPLHRYIGSHQEIIADNSDYEMHTYPFQELPLIELHVPPHFIIYHAGKKLAANFKQAPPNHDQFEQLYGFRPDDDIWSCLTLTMSIYLSWKKTMVDADDANLNDLSHSSQMNSSVDSSYDEDEDDREDDCSATEDEIDEAEFHDSIVEWSQRVEAAAIGE